MKKKLTAILLVAAMTISLSAGAITGNSNYAGRPGVADDKNNASSVSPASLDASTAEKWGSCGANLTWYYGNNMLVIRGVGDMDNFSLDFEDLPWVDLQERIQRIYIEDGVMSIGKQAFTYCSNLISVNIPDSVTYIGTRAFWGCSSLTSIDIPDSVNDILDGVHLRAAAA